MFRLQTILLSVLLAVSSGSFAAENNRLKSLEGSWRLAYFQSMSDEQGLLTPDNPADFILNIHPDGRAQMSLGCNRAMGDWQASPSASGNSGQFTFGILAGTRAKCPPPAIDELITAQAPYVRSYFLEENNLYLSLMADGGIFAWNRVSGPNGVLYTPVSPEEGGPRNWQVSIESGGLNLRQHPSIASPIIGSFSRGTVLENFGCRSYESRIWCDVQALGGGARGHVAHSYLAPAISPNGHAMFGPDDSAIRAGLAQFDAKGFVKCADSPTAEFEQCAFGVARSGGGYASLVVTHPSGRERVFYFRMGQAIGASSSEADNPGVFEAKRMGDTYFISLGKERYQIPEAAVLGG